MTGAVEKYGKKDNAFSTFIKFVVDDGGGLFFGWFTVFLVLSLWRNLSDKSEQKSNVIIPTKM